MIVEKIKEAIVCDMVGCGNLAVYQIKNGEADLPADSLNLCKDCASKLTKALNGIMGVKVNGKDKR